MNDFGIVLAVLGAVSAALFAGWGSAKGVGMGGQADSEVQLVKTRQEVEQILKEAEKNRQAQYEMSIKQVDAEVKQLLDRGKSATDLQKRKLLLDAKQQLIQRIFRDALDTILKMQQEEYFKLLLGMVDHYALNEQGEIHFSEQDLGRMPDSFVREMEKRQITISKQPVRMRGGFLLSYGEIEVNCSIEALLEANREILQDQIVKLVF